MSSSNQPLVYIILVNWNGKEDTLCCLGSLSKVRYPNYKIILVDNASRDGSVNAVSHAFPNVTLIENKTNTGFAHANNQAIELSLQEKAEYVLLLNNDTHVDSEFLGYLVERAESDTKIGMVGGKIYYDDEPNKIWFAGGVIKIWKGLIAHRGIREEDKGQFDNACESGYITGCCLLVKRNCVAQIGNLDESYYIYTEDADWCYRGRLAGFKLFYEPHAKIWHKISSSSGGRKVPDGMTSFKVSNKIRSMFQFLNRYTVWYHWLTIPFFMAAYFLKAVVLMLLSKNIAALKALFVAIVKR